MKVVAIQGSPHKGNTYDRVERFGQALTNLGDVDFNHIALKDMELIPCRGCFTCFTQGESSCPLQDDRAMIESQLGEADAVVFASPVYSMQISYLLKRFVDRLAYTFHRPRYFGQYAVGLAVSGGIGLKETCKYIKMFSQTWGFEYAGDLQYIDPPKNTGLPRFLPMQDNTEKLAHRLHHLMKTKPVRRLTVNDHLIFHAMRAVYSRMEKYSPMDFAYWKNNGWLDPKTRYFTDHARAGLIKSIYPRIVAWMMSRAMDKKIATVGDSVEQDNNGGISN